MFGIKLDEFDDCCLKIWLSASSLKESLARVMGNFPDRKPVKADTGCCGLAFACSRPAIGYQGPTGRFMVNTSSNRATC